MRLTLLAGRPAVCAALSTRARTSAKLAAMSPAAIDTLMGQDELVAARTTLARISSALNARNAPRRDLPPLILLTDDQRNADWPEAVRALPAGSAIIVLHRKPVERERVA